MRHWQANVCDQQYLTSVSKELCLVINSNIPGRKNSLAVRHHRHFSVNLFARTRSTEVHSGDHLQGCSENDSLAPPWPPPGWTGFSSSKLHGNLYIPVHCALEGRGHLCLIGYCSFTAWHTVGSQWIRQQPQGQPQGYLQWAASWWLKTCEKAVYFSVHTAPSIVMVCQSMPSLKTKEKCKVPEDEVWVIFPVLPDL